MQNNFKKISHTKIVISLFVVIAVGILAFWQSEKAVYKNGSLHENKKIKINDNYSFEFQFSEKPKIGTIILKISVLNQNDEKVDNLAIEASYNMPGMPDMKNHDSFMLNKKSDYLLPINVAMPGNWEIEIIFKEKSHEIYRGNILFEI